MPEEGNPPSWTVPSVRDAWTSISPSSAVPADASRSIFAVVSVEGPTSRRRFAEPTAEVTCVTGTLTAIVPTCRTRPAAHAKRSVSRTPVVGHAYVSAAAASTDVARLSWSPLGMDAMSPI